MALWLCSLWPCLLWLCPLLPWQEFEEYKQQQAVRQQLIAQRQRAMLQEAAERQKRQRATAGQSQSQPASAPAPAPPPPADGGGAAPLPETTEALVSHVLRHRVSAHLCLGVARFAPHDVVRKRYHALALRLHPDKVKHAQAAEAFAVVEAAFRLLCPG